MIIAELPMPEPTPGYVPPVHTLESIETDRLVLRALRPEDAEDLLAFAGDKDTAYWAGMEPFRDITEAEEDIELGNIFSDDPQYGITLKGEDRVIGQICVMNDLDSDGKMTTFIGYLISKDYSRRGYMTEALSAVCRHIFESWSVGRVECEIRKDNIPSRGLASKCGFVQNPEQRHWRLNHYGKPLDEFILTREAFQSTIENQKNAI